ncbi:hypothetical protein [Streptomyces sp. NPDC056669]|uniref:hypothetical protein n=1 Tax=Streptomyces sp. NPDC056669 TaxID=3345903 RepID=UPI00369F2DC2
MTRRTMTPVALSDAAAEAIRELNHLTRIRQADWEYPGDAYSTVANLALLVQRLPQALEQIQTFITELHDGGHLVSDRGRHIDDEVAAVKAGLTWAADDAHTLAERLDQAHSALSPLGYTGPLDGPDEEPCGEGMCQCYCLGDRHPCGCDCPHREDCDCDFCTETPL